MYWELEPVRASDRRFNAEHFGAQPQWLIEQAIASIEQRRNLEQLTQAKQLQTFCNTNRAENTPPYEDVSLFLPHPNQWQIATHERKVNVSRETAISFLQGYSSYNSEVLMAFDEWLRDIQIIASS